MALQDVVDIMNGQIALYSELIALEDDKKHSIIHNRYEDLNRLVQKETKLLKQAGELEEKRIFEVNRYVVGKGYRPSPGVTVSDIVKLTTRHEEKQLLTTAQQDLVALLQQLKEINQLNQLLAEHSLDIIQYSIDVMTGMPEDDMTYCHPGQQQPAANRLGMYDFRA